MQGAAIKASEASVFRHVQRFADHRRGTLRAPGAWARAARPTSMAPSPCTAGSATTSWRSTAAWRRQCSIGWPGPVACRGDGIGGRFG